jgi:photosystem II stability/assembly factor-like uncharacterized protein
MDLRTTKIKKVMDSIVKFWKRLVPLLALVLLCVGCSNVPSLSYNPWETIELPTEANLIGIGFGDDLEHGWVVGANATLFETTDGGENWEPKTLKLDSDNYRFNSVSFKGREGWIVGEPALLLHTEDDGQTWEQIKLSEKLPGQPNKILALDPQTAEMTTDVGAIYRTEDAGKHWSALVEQSVGVIRNLERGSDGKYIAVSAKGNFYSTWEPGQKSWVGHNRNSSRRIQNMGFTEDGRLWMLARGGQIQFSESATGEEWQEPIYPEFSTSWGLLDLAYRTPDEIWVSGGSGNLLCSLDGGQTWKKDREVEQVPSNFYKIVFLDRDRGFIIGQRGILLKYRGQPEAA